MRSTISSAVAAATALLLASTTAATPLIRKQANGSNLVFSHYMVGVTDGSTPETWSADISAAQAAGVDGFALNVGSADGWNAEQLGYAYEAASSAGFSLFMSFDMAASSWTVEQVVQYINDYSGYSAALMVDGVPFVSTFEGPDWASNWQSVRDQTGGIYLVPDWASIGPDGVAGLLDSIEGAFSWSAWPGPGETQKTTDEDYAYLDVLGDKPYMMAVSPYFYTNLPQYSKNWYSSSDSLWFDRWKQVLEVMPAYIELITWNDYGESHYLNNPTTSQIVSGAETYVSGFDHSAFTFVMPYFISAYKAGSVDGVVPASQGAMAWYRTTSKSLCGDGGSVWGQGGSASAADATEDVISVIALSTSGSAPAISVTVGGTPATVEQVDSVGAAYFFQASFEGMSGTVTVDMDGSYVDGPEISTSCPASGITNFNAATIQISI